MVMACSKTLVMAILRNLPLVLFSIILNTSDVYSDLKLIIHLFLGMHPYYAVLVLVPFLANYVLCIIIWFRDKTNHWGTIIFPLLNLYTPYGISFVHEADISMYKIFSEAGRVIMGQKKKEVFKESTSLLEVFVESIPCSMILTFMLVKVVFGCDDANSLCNIVIGKHRAWFWISYFTSFLSSALGLAKCLKVGVVRIIGPGGPLDGFCTPRFILAFLASGTTLLARAVCMVLACSANVVPGTMYNVPTVVVVLMIFFPQAILSLSLVLSSDRSSVTILFQQPTIVLMPIYTHFTFSRVIPACLSSNYSRCWQEPDKRVMFSTKATLMNIALTTIALATLTLLSVANIPDGQRSYFFFMSPFLPFFVCGVIFTLPLLNLNRLLTWCCILGLGAAYGVALYWAHDWTGLKWNSLPSLILTIFVPLYLLGLVLTLSLHYHCCSCCSACPAEEIRVFNPANPDKILVYKGGEVKEMVHHTGQELNLVGASH